MFIPAHEAAEQCGISAGKLEKLTKRKDRPKKMMNDEGNYNPDVINKFLKRLKACAAEVCKRNKQQKETGKGRAIKRGRKARRFIPEQETLEEFQTRFWATDGMWQEFCLNELSEEWVRYFIRKALAFGHAAAYPE